MATRISAAAALLAIGSLLAASAVYSAPRAPTVTRWCGVINVGKSFRLRAHNLGCSSARTLATNYMTTGNYPRGYFCAADILYCWTRGHARWFRGYPYTPPPPPPPPAPPPPSATPGHYKGTTSQNEDFEFDVTSDGSALHNLKTGQVNEDCTPAGIGIYGGNLDFGSYTVAIDASGAFKIDVTFNGGIIVNNNTDPTTQHVVITGHFSGAIASGTFLETTQFTDQGIAYSCSSNPQTWTATQTG